MNRATKYLETSLQFAYQIPGQTWPRELIWLYNAVLDTNATCVVEIGSYCGRSLWIIAAALNTLGGRKELVSVDARTEGVDPTWIDGVFTTTLQAIRREFPAVDVEVCKKTSLEACLTFSKKADLIFIDGDHNYAPCVGDIEGWRSHLSPTGLLCGHDYWPAHIGVMDAVNYAVPDFKVIPNTRIWRAL